MSVPGLAGTALIFFVAASVVPCSGFVAAAALGTRRPPLLLSRLARHQGFLRCSLGVGKRPVGDAAGRLAPADRGRI